MVQKIVTGVCRKILETLFISRINSRLSDQPQLPLPGPDPAEDRVARNRLRHGAALGSLAVHLQQNSPWAASVCPKHHQRHRAPQAGLTHRKSTSQFQRLHLVVNNTRFLLLGEAGTFPGLSTHALSGMTQQLSAD